MEQIRGTGGPSRVGVVAKKMRREYDNSLVLFAGDTMSPSVWSNEFHGLQMIDAHNALDVDYACLGNHEFDFGLEAFYNVTTASHFTWLNANCYLKDTRELLPTTTPRAIKTFDSPSMGKLKVGVFGIMYNMETKEELYFSDALAAAQREAMILKYVYHVDFVIALTHQLEVDDQLLARDVRGIDLILGGHDHTSMNNINTHGLTETIYLKSTQDFRDVWRSSIELQWDAAGNVLHKMKHENIQIVEEMETDAEIEGIITHYRDLVGERHKEVVGHSCMDLDLTQELVRKSEAPIGNFFTDATVAAYKELHGEADVALTNGGGIRTNTIFRAGNITLGDVVAWHPFGNTVIRTSVSGQDFRAFVLKYALDSCGSSGIVENGHFIHPSKFNYTLECTGPTSGKLNEFTWKNGQRITDEDHLDVAMPDYMYDLMVQLIGEDKVKTTVHPNEAMRLDSILIDHIKQLPNQTVCPKVEGRVAIKFSGSS